jgi:hypothetical protein
MRVADTLRSTWRGFNAGKYILAEVGEMKAAQVTMITIYDFFFVLKAE